MSVQTTVQLPPPPSQLLSQNHSQALTRAANISRQHQVSLPHAVASSGRLKYAEPRDLPSYPSLGLRQSDAAASAAASLGWASRKPVLVTDSPLTALSASAAALLASGYKSTAQLASDKNDMGSTAAIIAAAKRPASAVAPSSTATWGSSAANQAFKAGSLKHRSVPASTPSSSGTGSLRAAKDAMASGRPRAVSNPAPKYTPAATSYPDEANAAANALTAATTAHRRTTSADEGRGNGKEPPKFLNMGRQMFTSQPPVQMEVEEQKRADVLHASAVAMAKRMYTQQQQRDANVAAKLVQGGGDVSSGRTTPQSPQFTNLQEAAYKLAQERLKRLQEEHDRSRDYHGYYGGQPTSPLSRHFIKNKLRRRSSSDGAVSGVPHEYGPRRLSLLPSKASSNKLRQEPFDAEQRQRDREALFAAARRNVKAQLKGIDRKVLADTGMVPPTLQDEWELKAQAAARARSEIQVFNANVNFAGAQGSARHRNNAGKVDIGGGMFMNQSEIDAIALRRVQPFLDEINENAEKERERLAVIKAEQERKREKEELERAREKEVRDLHEKLKSQQKGQEKARKEEIKLEEKQRKELEKEIKSEQKRQTKEEARKSKLMGTAQQQTEPEVGQSTDGDKALLSALDPLGDHKKQSKGRALHLRLPSIPGKLQPTPKDKGKGKEPLSASPTTPTTMEPAEEGSPTSKVKNWLKSRFRPRAKSSVEAGSFVVRDNRKSAFIGGAALAAAGGGVATHQRAASDTSSSLRGGPGGASMREVALAGRFVGGSAVSLHSGAGHSSGSSSPGRAVFVQARETLTPPPPISDAELTPPPTIRDPALRKSKSGSPVRDSRFFEMM